MSYIYIAGIIGSSHMFFAQNKCQVLHHAGPQEVQSGKIMFLRW